MPDRRRYIIDADLADLTLAQSLKALSSMSWSEVKRHIANGHVQINGNLCTNEARPLKPGDVLHDHAEPLGKAASPQQLVIRHIDDHLLVVEKPCGVTSVRHAEERGWPERRKQLQPTLDEMLIEKLNPPRSQRRPAPRPKPRGRSASPREIERNRPAVLPVHRLDRDTSGLMLFARTREAEQHLMRMFKLHTVERIYHAVVVGRFEGRRTIDTLLARDRGDGKRGTVLPGVNAAGAQRAITHVRAIDPLGQMFTIVECKLETGRTHQIRIHLSELGHPICGEPIYRTARDTSAAPRQALHAAVIGFVHPITGKTHRFDWDWPKDLQRWLDDLPHKQGVSR